MTGPAVRQAIKMVSAIGQRGELSFQIHEGSMNAERFIEFLAGPVHDFALPIFLVVDGSSVHKVNIVKKIRRRHEGKTGYVLPSVLLSRTAVDAEEWVKKNVMNDRTESVKQGYYILCVLKQSRP